ncbi:gamma-glutamyltransferase [Labedaea rhizosphaerae]|uniref:Gamma-glutamyltranspeptidase/glutathione hydrolase n=1 Tax=Labedaea rhizosphaerae TaxID=598644 RepID=A0A4R6SFB8_LABRH|nr:gamma-glutamyltransferase [Labedaea rhizosphaerae]TDP97786.1 gamma-glutamyltranspeptidase/glutathione hydrolase [Labedaea rhizosphaerae]
MDPEAWDSEEVHRYLTLGLDKPDLDGASGTGTKAMVVGSTGPFAQLAGRKALEAGGSATDAVIATALTQIALAAGSWVSYAGVFHLVHAGEDRTDSLSAGYATFAEEDDAASIPKAPEPSGRTALVPGFMAGIASAHERFGVLPWADLFAAAIHVAEQGFPVGALRAGQFALRKDVLPESFRAQRGDTFRQPELATTLRAVATEGADWMYRGPWAREFVAVVRAAGGKATMDDLARYQPIWADPLTVGFRGTEVHTIARPDTGGAALAAALRLAEDVDGDPLEDPRALHDLIKITRQAMRPGSHSDFVLAVDERGNVAAACHTINTSLWGSTGLFAGGVSIPDSACFQQRALAGLGPGEHLPCPVNPAIALRDGRPVLASSSIGTGLQCATLQGVHAVLGLGLPVDEVVRRPMFHGPDYLAGDTVTTTLQERLKGKAVGSAWQNAVARAKDEGVPREQVWDYVMAAVPQVIDDRFDPAVVRATEELGQALAPRPLSEPTMPRGFWGGIQLGDGPLVGGRTPFSGGTVEGL